MMQEIQTSQDRVQIIRDIYRQATGIVGIINNKLLNMEIVASYDLTKSQFQALNILSRQSKLTSSGLASALGMAKSNTTPLIDALVYKDYVKRIYGQKDRRKIFLELTETGMSVIEEIYAAMAHHAGAAIHSATMEQLIRLQDTLDRLKLSIDPLT